MNRREFFGEMAGAAAAAVCPRPAGVRGPFKMLTDEQWKRGTRYSVANGWDHPNAIVINVEMRKGLTRNWRTINPGEYPYSTPIFELSNDNGATWHAVTLARPDESP